MEDEVVDALVTAVKEAYAETSHRYWRLKAKWLGKDTLEYWDIGAPLPTTVSTFFSSAMSCAPVGLAGWIAS